MPIDAAAVSLPSAESGGRGPTDSLAVGRAKGMRSVACIGGNLSFRAQMTLVVSSVRRARGAPRTRIIHQSVVTTHCLCADCSVTDGLAVQALAGRRVRPGSVV